jgi:hypothetical protein
MQEMRGQDALPLRFKLWFDRVFALARSITRFAASILASKKRDLEGQRADILRAPTLCELARQIQARIARARDQLLTFCDHPGEVDATNNASKRDLRPACDCEGWSDWPAGSSSEAAGQEYDGGRCDVRSTNTACNSKSVIRSN